MDLKLSQGIGQKFAEVLSHEIEIRSAQDALDIMMSALYQGCTSLIIHEKNIDPSFFELRTGLAGEILQKYSNYKMRLAIVGSFDKFESKSLSDFIVECNRGNQIFFVPDLETAIRKIS